MSAQMRTVILSVLCCSILCGCLNLPPNYKGRAEKQLNRKGVEKETIHKLLKKKELTEDEAKLLYKKGNTAVLHLLAENPSVPAPILDKLGSSWREEVITGYVSNPAVAIDDVLKHRTKGQYSLVNSSIARNPKVPEEILSEMYYNKEGGKYSFAANENCPEEIMWDVFKNGSFTDHCALALNPNTPEKLLLELEAEAKAEVTGHQAISIALDSNPTYHAMLEHRQ